VTSASHEVDVSLSERAGPRGVVDTLIGFPADQAEVYAGVRRSLRDKESLEQLEMPAGYMFHDVPEQHRTGADVAIATTLAAMDAHGISVGLISLGVNRHIVEAALERYPMRFVPSWTIDPNQGIAGLRQLDEVHDRFRLRAVSFTPHTCTPPVPVDGPHAYAYYAKCVELGLPVFITVGVPGPRVPMEAQHVDRLDEVMYDFPDLVVVMRHGAEPWTDMAVKLMLKWPNLYYSTSGFSPRFYPEQIIRFANTRGAGKILYAGYFPMGLTLERIFTELEGVPIRDEVWPRFLGDNARHVLGLNP
jgi:predicted TIM-barrel fold metal-dependent hydrolase